MEQVAESLYRLGQKHHNFYLIIDGGKATVVDAGGSRELPRLEQGLAQAGLTLDDVEALLITHAHTDHIGFARLLQDRGVSVKTHEAEAAFAMDASAGSQVGVSDLPWWRPQTVAFLTEMIRAGAGKGYRLKNVDTIVDGEKLDLPGSPMVIATPGHTKGHASYAFESRRAVCSGDAMVTDALIGTRSGPQLLDSAFHLDFDRANESLDRLADLDTDLLLPGHGDPWKGPIAEAVVRARA